MIVYNRLLCAWFVVRGPHQFPLSGAFASRADAQAWLQRKRETRAMVRRALAEQRALDKAAT